MILSIHKKLSMLKNLSMLEPNFEEADGLGIKTENRQTENCGLMRLCRRLLNLKIDSKKTKTYVIIW